MRWPLLLALVPFAASAQVSNPKPGLTVVRIASAMLAVVDLCAPGVSVRATTYAERKRTPRSWAQLPQVAADLAVNVDFFDFPDATKVIGRARGDGQDWPADKQLFEVRSYWQFGPGLAAFQPNAAVVPSPAATEVLGGHIVIIENGQSLGPGFGGDPTITNAHRRTALGASADRRTLFVFVSDAALTGTQLVAQMRALASQANAPAIDVATNVDGGKSSQAYLTGVGALFETGRLVANHLGVRATGSGPAPNCPAPTCTNQCERDAEDRVGLAGARVGQGYVSTTATGATAAFGNARFHGSLLGRPLNQPITGIAVTPSGLGYWLVAKDGGVFAFGDAPFKGSAVGVSTAPVVGIAPTPDGQGYWLVASDGGVFAFGSAPFKGSAGGGPLNAPVVGIASAPDGQGYWLVASDGGVFAYGSAPFKGSAGGGPLNAPVVGIAATPDGQGYWLAAKDGGVFAFGSAGFHGSLGSTTLAKPVVGIAAAADGLGYWMLGADGGVFAFGSARFLGTARPDQGCSGATPLACVAGFSTCAVWSPKPTCAAGDVCRNGACEAACSDDCAAGQSRCDGAAGQVCANVDADPCLDWAPAVACVVGKACAPASGTCASPTCTDACVPGAARCTSAGVETCRPAASGCTAWSAPERCTPGLECENGRCSAAVVVPGLDAGADPEGEAGAPSDGGAAGGGLEAMDAGTVAPAAGGGSGGAEGPRPCGCGSAGSLLMLTALVTVTRRPRRWNGSLLRSE